MHPTFSTNLIRPAKPNTIPLMKKRILLVSAIVAATLTLSPVLTVASWFKPFYPHTRENQSLWPAISEHFALQTRENIENSQSLIDWYRKKPYYLKQLGQNAAPYLYYVYQQTLDRQMPAEVALLPMVESNYNPFAYSDRGATGLWQMMPGTGSGFGLDVNWWYDGRRDIVASTKAALDYLQYLYNYLGDWLLAIAAYDSGEGTVKRAIAHNKKLGKPTDFWSLHLPAETKTYIPKLIALSTLIKNQTDYQIAWPTIKNQPYLASVNMDAQIDINQAAELAGVTLEKIRELNPGFRRWATSPASAYIFLLPLNKIETFKNNLAKLPKDKLTTWLHHVVKPGESLSVIAAEHKTTIDIIKRVNGLKNSIIHPGESLLAPLAYKGKLNIKINRQHGKIAEDKMPGPQYVNHVIEHSDTLDQLAKLYGVTVNQIRYWNTLAYHDKLKIGEKLIIWLNHKPKNMDVLNYEVSAGDTLSQIATRFNTTTTLLKLANHLRNNFIRIHQHLNIPDYIRQIHTSNLIDNIKDKNYPIQMITYHVRPGDNLTIIANRLGISIKQLKDWNNLNTLKYLHPGQPLQLAKQ